MPLEVDTRRTFPYVLVEDQDLPQDQRRTLLIRNVPARDYALIQKAFVEAWNAADATVTVAGVLDGVRIALAGWRGFKDDDGQPLPYDPAQLDVVLEMGDVIQLHADLLLAISGDETARKKAAWQSRSGTAASADSPPATPAGA